MLYNNFARLRSRRVLVLRLEVSGLGVDAKSVRSVRKRQPCVRDVSASVRAENRRETQDCRHFWTRVWSSRLKRVNFRKDWGGCGAAKCGIVLTFGLAFGLNMFKQMCLNISLPGLPKASQMASCPTRVKRNV